MALRESELHVRFAGGIETKTDAKAVPTTKLLALENGVFTRAISIRKRNGYEDLAQVVDGSALPVSGAIRMAVRGGELLEFISNRCYSRQTGADQWSDAGSVFSVVGADRPLVKTGTQQAMPDHATLDGVTVAAWEDSAGGVWWSTVDASTGRVLRAPTQADVAGRSPRCVPVDDVLHVYYAVPTQRRIMILVVSPTAPSAAVTPAILVEDLDSTQPVYDACSTQRGGSEAAIAWFEHATTNIRLGYVTAAGVLGSPANDNPSVLTYTANRQATSPIGVSFASASPGSSSDVDDRFLVAYVDATSTGVVATFNGGRFDTPLSATGTVNAIATTSVQRIAVVALDQVNSWTAWEEAAVAPSNRFTTCVPVAGSAGASTTIRSVGLASRAFVVGGEVFAVFVHDTNAFNVYLTLRLSDGIAVGRHAPGGAAGAPTRQHLSSVHVSDSVATLALPFRERLISENNDKFRETGLRLFRLDFDNEASHQYAQLGAGLYLAGACPQHYDGRVWTEQGFHVGPELIAATPAAGGSMTSSTTYEYRAWYESTDGQGEVHLGPTSVGTLVTMGGADTQVTLTLPTLRVTGKSNVRIGVARSLAAVTGDTARLFRVTSLDPTTVGTANGYVASDKTVDTVTFIDRMDDTTLRLQEELYTDGGVLSNDPSPLGAVIARGKSRLFATDPSDGNVLRYSQPLDDGFGVEWPPDLTIRCDPVGGDITGLAFQDGRGFIFKETAIQFFDGDGPTISGDASTTGFTDPQQIPSAVGCTEPASIVSIPAGYLFKSDQGIQLLDRSGSVTYVGAPVETYNAQRIRRATAMPGRTEVVFLTDDGSTLHYNYLFGQWSTFTNHEGLDAVVADGQYHYLRTDGRVFRETIGAYSDAGTRIRLRLETAWVHMQEQLQGFSQFWYLHLLGTWASAHQLGVQYQTEYIESWTDPFWLDATGESSSTGWITGGNAQAIGVEPIVGTAYGDGLYGAGVYGGTAADVYQWRIDLNEHGQSIRFRFEDFERDGLAGASFELTEMALTGGVIGNAVKPFKASRST